MMMLLLMIMILKMMTMLMMIMMMLMIQPVREVVRVGPILLMEEMGASSKTVLSH